MKTKTFVLITLSLLLSEALAAVGAEAIEGSVTGAIEELGSSKLGRV